MEQKDIIQSEDCYSIIHGFPFSGTKYQMHFWKYMSPKFDYLG